LFRYPFFLLLLLFLLCLGSIQASADINLTSIGEGGILAWEKEVFDGETIYETSVLGGTPALKATSNDAASGLLLKQPIDLLETPYLNWSWLITQYLPFTDERAKAGDDFAARVYVVIEGGFFVWNTKSVTYVWSSSQETGESWGNPFAESNVKMISVRGKDDNLNQWYHEKRNVYQDLIAMFGDKGSDEANLKAYRYIDVVALMTDTDNSGASAESYYGDILFSSD
jgi:hypothetical protein